MADDQTRPQEDTPGMILNDLPAEVAGLLSETLDVNATDVHVDPVGPDAFRICYRVDGVIQPKTRLNRRQGQHLVNQVKVAAEFSPDRTFTPLEGSITLKADDKELEIRVTTMPTTRGEALHLRVLSAPEEVLKPAELGLPDSALTIVRETLKRPEGLILISGPTGAGKTMTLYSLASFLKLDSMIAVSVEDPVEYDLPYVRQVETDAEHDFSMQQALKSVLRMDPDIILLGEIRDTPSAMAAVRAAASGRFVLATTHARDAAMAVESLQHLSVPRHLLGSTLRMITSQSLVRRVCTACGGEREPEEEEKAWFADAGLKAPDKVPVPEGCDQCHHIGYKGRIGVFQVATFNRALQNLVSRGKAAEAIRKELARQEVPTVNRDALGKVAAGITSMEEIRDLHVPGRGQPEG